MKKQLTIELSSMVSKLMTVTWKRTSVALPEIIIRIIFIKDGLRDGCDNWNEGSQGAFIYYSMHEWTA